MLTPVARRPRGEHVRVDESGTVGVLIEGGSVVLSGQVAS